MILMDAVREEAGYLSPAKRSEGCQFDRQLYVRSLAGGQQSLDLIIRGNLLLSPDLRRHLQGRMEVRDEHPEHCGIEALAVGHRLRRMICSNNIDLPLELFIRDPVDPDISDLAYIVFPDVLIACDRGGLEHV